MDKQPNQVPEKENSARTKNGYYIGFGIAIGVALGAAFDNLGVGIALGVAIGAAIEGVQKRRAS